MQFSLNPLSESSEPQGDFSVNTAFDFRGLNGKESTWKFGVCPVQEILADNCKFESFIGPPAQAEVQLSIPVDDQVR